MGYTKNQPILQTAIPAVGYIRRHRLIKLLGTSLSTLDHWVHNGKMLKPIKPGERSTAFDAVEINRWLEERRNTSA